MSDAHRDEITKLESLYEEHPEGRIFTPLAEAYRKAGELERAHQVLADGLDRHPDYSSAHVVLGRVLMDQGRTDEADAEFRRVLELDPHNLIAIRALGDLARSRGDQTAALEYYHRLLEQESNDEVREIVDELSRGIPAEPELHEEAPGEPDLHEWAPPDSAEADEDWRISSELESELEAEPGGWVGAAPDPDVRDEREDALDNEPEPADDNEPEPTDEGWVGGVIEREPELEAEPGALGDEGPYPAEPEDTEVRTETIAQVYARQGLYDRAAEIYRGLVRARPNDPDLHERLEEMEQLAAQADHEEVDAMSGVQPESESADEEALLRHMG
ncbi:MAG: tetratricopeptide repeat protein, partial [Gemmatimonadota bacterium]